MSKRTQPPVAPMQVPHAWLVRGPDGKFYAVAGEVSSIRRLFEATHGPQFERCNRSNAPPWHRRNCRRKTVALPQKRNARSCSRQEIREEENEQVKESQEVRDDGKRRLRDRPFNTPEQDRSSILKPIRAATGGTGPARGTGLAGAGGLDVDVSDTIDPRQLFNGRLNPLLLSKGHRDLVPGSDR